MITQQEWIDNPKLANELEQALKTPIIVEAFALLKTMTMAQVMDGPALLDCNNTTTLFGYDVGRASIFRDLQTLSTVQEPPKQLTATYKKE